MERHVPLWPETIEALQASAARRPKPQPDTSGLFFLIHDGRSWDNSMNPIARYFRQCYQRAGIKDGGFYWARHTFATIASGSRDQVAVNTIMGHVDPTMAANYREHIDEARLRAVVEHVRSWLFW